jgi:predicted N-formylglutamate amidohydrolase
VSTRFKNKPQDGYDNLEPIIVKNSRSTTPVLLVCEHASNYIPEHYHNLGLQPEPILQHIGWDVGALAVAAKLARILDSELVFQKYSRLLIDCNRPLSSSALIPEVTENTAVPGNLKLTQSERQLRIETIWQPFQNAIADSLDWRESKAIDTVLVAVHSFNETYMDETRPWQICLAYNRDDRLAKLMQAELSNLASEYVIALNKPYFVEDLEDQTIPVFGEQRRIPHVLLEIRNDLISDSAGQEFWGRILATAIARSIPRIVS